METHVCFTILCAISNNSLVSQKYKFPSDFISIILYFFIIFHLFPLFSIVFFRAQPLPSHMDSRAALCSHPLTDSLLETGHQLEADTISFGATLSVCKKAQEWQWAMCLLKDAQRRLVPLFLGQFDGFWWVSLGRKNWMG